MINIYASKTNSILLSFGDVKQIADTLYLKDKINGAEINLIYSDDKNKVSVKKGFYLIKSGVFMNTNNIVDENYYSTIAINKFELPHSTDLSPPKIAVYYTSDEQFNLKLEKGKYIYSIGNIIISYGNWVQKKDIIELTDKQCNAVFQFKKMSDEELVCNTIFGILKYNNPNISSASNHFYIPK